MDTNEEVKETKSTALNNLEYFDVLIKMLCANQPNIPLEKEVSYLQGKVDTLEKLLLSR